MFIGTTPQFSAPGGAMWGSLEEALWDGGFAVNVVASVTAW